jgi:hypothetical protein
MSNNKYLGQPVWYILKWVLLSLAIVTLLLGLSYFIPISPQSKSIIFYGLGVVCIAIALILYKRWFKNNNGE